MNFLKNKIDIFDMVLVSIVAYFSFNGAHYFYSDTHMEMAVNWKKAEEAALKDVERNANQAKKQFKRKYETIISWRFDREYDLFPVSQKNYEQIDKIIDIVIDKLEKKKKIIKWEDEIEWARAYATMGIISSVLEETVYRQYDGKLYFLADGINRKRLDCQTLATIYMGIAEIMKLPLSSVIIPGEPGHMFVRWQMKDGQYLNWDPVSSITPERDEYYEKKWHMPKEKFIIVKLDDFRNAVIKKMALSYAYDNAERNEADFIKRREYSLKKYAMLR